MNRWGTALFNWAWTATPITVIALFLINLTALIKYWGPIMARRNERLRDVNDQRVGDWIRLRERIEKLEERCDRLQEEVDECRNEKAEWQSRAITAEAVNIGRGQSAQEITILDSAKRIVEGKQELKP